MKARAGKNVCGEELNEENRKLHMEIEHDTTISKAIKICVVCGEKNEPEFEQSQDSIDPSDIYVSPHRSVSFPHSSSRFRNGGRVWRFDISTSSISS